MAVVPSDHHVAPDAAYREALRALLGRARASGRILTLGLRPTFPATGYGYLEVGEARAETTAGPVHAVARYVEKPARPAANRFVRSGRHLWNLGTFAFTPKAFLDAFATHFPEGAQAFAPVLATKRFGPRLAAAYRAVPSISVDYAVMEKCRDLEVLATASTGTTSARGTRSRATRAPTPQGNVLGAGHLAVDAVDCFVRADDGTAVALLGVSDLIVVRTKDALLVARRGPRARTCARSYEAWKAKGREDLLRVIGRLGAVDYGRKRIGLAVCDALGITVTGLDTLVRTGTVEQAVAAVAGAPRGARRGEGRRRPPSPRRRPALGDVPGGPGVRGRAWPRRWASRSSTSTRA